MTKKIAAVFVLLLTVVSMNSTMASTLKLGLYVTDSTGPGCAYIVTEQHTDGVLITFVHDPRYLPVLTCSVNGFDRYPIGAVVKSSTEFVDVRNDNKYF